MVEVAGRKQRVYLVEEGCEWEGVHDGGQQEEGRGQYGACVHAEHGKGLLDSLDKKKREEIRTGQEETKERDYQYAKDVFNRKCEFFCHGSSVK